MPTSRDPDTETTGPTTWVVLLSVALVFFTLPHALEDFALGEPQSRGIPAPVIATVLSLLFAAQAMGLYWIGQRRARGLRVHVILGLLWPLASGFAQLPLIFGDAPYRSGPISVAYVFGIILGGALLFASSLAALRTRGRDAAPAAGHP
jgi:hypothetical protein